MSEKKKPNIVGSAYRELKALIERYAKADEPVLFIGEQGSGKELFGEYYYAASGREGGYHTIDCGGAAQHLLESELFGHKRGAFTGAYAERKGLLETAGEGIIFLDELGNAVPGFQDKIMRVTEGKKYRPVGRDEEKETRALFIGATNNPKGVRPDLKDRFAAILPVPPLQRFDIPHLAKEFCKDKKGELKSQVLADLMSRQYPGNVRELKRVCKQLEIERGDGVFIRKSSETAYPEAGFDYDRFRKEYTVWEKYIQPMLDKYKFYLRYEYCPVRPEFKRKNPEDFQRMVNLFDPGPRAEARRALADLASREAWFDEIIWTIEGVGLPFLLEELHLKLDRVQERMKWPADLSHILETVPYQAAVDTFASAYCHYHLDRNMGNKTKTAEALGIARTTLDRALCQKIENKITAPCQCSEPVVFEE